MAATMRSLGFHTVTGIDPSPTAISLARGKHGTLGLVIASAGTLPLRRRSQDCLVSLDVLEHLDDDRGALEEFARVLVPGSPLLLTVPAYQWAWSEHDVALGHRRRYTARTLQERCAVAGLTVERCFYFHSWLVPLALLVRKTPLRLLSGGSPEQTSYAHPLVNAALYGLTRAERLLSRLVRPPFGLSIMLLARVPRPTLALEVDAETAPAEPPARATG
jgi:SAM-dependent methyltransferase